MKVLFTEIGPEFSDVILLLNDVKILAHKAILAARCSYFKELFNSPLPLYIINVSVVVS